MFFLPDSRYEGPCLLVSNSTLQLLIPEIDRLRDSEDFSKRMGKTKTFLVVRQKNQDKHGRT